MTKFCKQWTLCPVLLRATLKRPIFAKRMTVNQVKQAFKITPNKFKQKANFKNLKGSKIKGKFATSRYSKEGLPFLSQFRGYKVIQQYCTY